jgi:hypothetical protein
MIGCAAYAQGHDDYLVKPFASRRMLAHVDPLPAPGS